MSSDWAGFRLWWAPALAPLALDGVMLLVSRSRVPPAEYSETRVYVIGWIFLLVLFIHSLLIWKGPAPRWKWVVFAVIHIPLSICIYLWSYFRLGATI
jgi:hypothetical protein